MTLNEAKERISRELMNGFVEWIRDWDALPDYDFGRKYYYGKRKVKPKFNFESLKNYMSDEFNGMWLPHWVKEGYPREIIYQLHREAWLVIRNTQTGEQEIPGIRTSIISARELQKRSGRNTRLRLCHKEEMIMGTRNLTVVYVDGEYRVAQYGQWDGYPSGQGMTCLKFLTEEFVEHKFR